MADWTPWVLTRRDTVLIWCADLFVSLCTRPTQDVIHDGIKAAAIARWTRPSVPLSEIFRDVDKAPALEVDPDWAKDRTEEPTP